MRDTLNESLKWLKGSRKRKKRISTALTLFSFLVVLDVFWVLRQPALTQAGDATCGIVEHSHDESCWENRCICDLPEEPHVHTDSCYERMLLCSSEEHIHAITCYADKTADVETQLDWQTMFADYPFTGKLSQDLVGIAQTQVGYTESEWNFEVDSNGIRRGYTRYGAWYGAPYSDWSAMFVSFCLHYANANPAEYPGNTGSDSMAAAWNKLGRYVPAGEYTPEEGDLVFLKNNRVGIVTKVTNATIYVIQGDTENTVAKEILSVTDPAITGWGITAEPELPEETEPIEETESAEETESPDATEPKTTEPVPEVANLLDISQGPAVFIFAGEKVSVTSNGYSVMSTKSVTDLITYLKAHHGNYYFTLLDTNNQELPKDADGNYIVTAETIYKLTLTVTNPEGFLPGTYQYQLPYGLQVNGGTGDFILTDGTNVGSWEVTDSGLITMVFNEEMNSRTDITISATMGIVFQEQEDPLDFDGKITVTIEKPPQEDLKTQLNKWAYQGNPDSEDKPDPTKLYWTLQIIGHEGSQIPGSIITDQLIMGDHTYTESDIAGGLDFGVSEMDPVTGQEINWHSWHVSPDDPNLVWTDTGWSYKMTNLSFTIQNLLRNLRPEIFTFKHR